MSILGALAKLSPDQLMAGAQRMEETWREVAGHLAQIAVNTSAIGERLENIDQQIALLKLAGELHALELSRTKAHVARLELILTRIEGYTAPPTIEAEAQEHGHDLTNGRGTDFGGRS